MYPVCAQFNYLLYFCQRKSAYFNTMKHLRVLCIAAIACMFAVPAWSQVTTPTKDKWNNIFPEDKTARPEVRENSTAKEDPIFDHAEKLAEFPGGPQALNAFMAHNVRYPALAMEMGIQGTVIIEFIVEKDGSISDARVVQSVSSDCDAEALRVVRLLPKYIPAKQNGKPVRTRYKLPFRFVLQ